jgi:hypothetical protein
LLAQREQKAAEEAQFKAANAQAPSAIKKPYKARPVLPTAAPSTAGSMLDSRMTRRSESPSQSPASSVFPEGSYMVLRDDVGAYLRANRELMSEEL